MCVFVCMFESEQITGPDKMLVKVCDIMNGMVFAEFRGFSHEIKFLCEVSVKLTLHKSPWISNNFRSELSIHTFPSTSLTLSYSFGY